MSTRSKYWKSYYDKDKEKTYKAKLSQYGIGYNPYGYGPMTQDEVDEIIAKTFDHVRINHLLGCPKARYQDGTVTCNTVEVGPGYNKVTFKRCDGFKCHEDECEWMKKYDFKKKEEIPHEFTFRDLIVLIKSNVKELNSFANIEIKSEDILFKSIDNEIKNKTWNEFIQGIKDNIPNLDCLIDIIVNGKSSKLRFNIENNEKLIIEYL